MLVFLTRITTIKVKYKWTKIKQYMFDEIERILDRDTLLVYPYFNEEFNIHDNARKLQLGSAISHKGKTIAFYSIKLTGAQQRYTVTEK